MTATTSRNWRNWAGNQHSRPARVRTPRSAQDVAAAVTEAERDGLTVRMVGAGHSFTGAARTDGVLLRPDELTRVRLLDAAAGLITVDAGLPLRRLNAVLTACGLGLTNMGDVDVQTVAGATQTGTHGTGRDSGSLAGQLHAIELVHADGSLATYSADDADRSVFDAARVGLGALGIVTAATLRVEPAFALEAREAPMPLDEVLARFDELARENEHFEFYWFPHTGATSTKRNNRAAAPDRPLGRVKRWFDDEFVANSLFEFTNRIGAAIPGTIPAVNRIASKVLGSRCYTDVAPRVFTTPRRVRFLEQEYAIPRANLVDALREIRALIDARDWRISFPVEVRVAPPDDPWLATAHGRPSAYIACHAYHTTPNPAYFRAVEDILVGHEGRPHWGKLHTRGPDYLARVYPYFDRFRELRDRLDPHRRFTNGYLASVLGD